MLYADNVTGRTRFRDNDLKFDLVEAIGEEEKLVLDAVSFDTINGTRIWVNTVNRGTEVDRTYKLRAWISDTVLISDTAANASYTTGEYAKKFASIKVSVFGDFNEKKITTTLYKEAETVLAANLLADDGDSRIVAGSSTAEINNYVSYSGELWQIVSLNNDGSMKLIRNSRLDTGGNTQNFFEWDAYTPFEETEIYDYLNGEYLNQLDNYENVLVTDYLWNGTEDNSATIDEVVKPAEATMIEGTVGLLNLYEYVSTGAGILDKTIKNNDKESSVIIPLAVCNTVFGNTINLDTYLNGNYNDDILITTHHSGLSGWLHTNNSITSFSSSCGNDARIRPSIVLKAGLKYLKGDGSSNDPFEFTW